MQLYMLLTLLRTYLPKKIVDYILANDIFNFNFGVPELDSIPMLKDFLSIFKIEHSDVALNDLSVETLSTFYNLFAHFLILLFAVIAHLIFWLIKSKYSKSKSENCFMKFVNWIANKTWNFFTFTLYLRTVMQASEF